VVDDEFETLLTDYRKKMSMNHKTVKRGNQTIELLHDYQVFEIIYHKKSNQEAKVEF
jgi:hypothetical protein